MNKPINIAVLGIVAASLVTIISCGGHGNSYNSGKTTASTATTSTATTSTATTASTGGCVNAGVTSPTTIVTSPTATVSGTFHDPAAGTYTLAVPAGAAPSGSYVNVAPLHQSALPTIPGTASFNPSNGDTFISTFQITDIPANLTAYNHALQLTSSGTIPSTIAVGSTIDLAILSNPCTPQASWVNVATFQVGTGGTITQNLATTQLPGIVGPGTFVLFKPSGSSSSVANYGVVLQLDDGAAGGLLQTIHVYDANGNLLTTPTIASLSVPGAGDLDGLSLTPDGSHGVMVDGGNTIRFFTGLNTGTPSLSSTTLDISAYGGDGDSLVILPDGDTVIASGDGNALVVITGFAAGTPVITDTIPYTGSRDGLVISPDGKALLARGSNGVTVYSITPKTPAPGALGGTEKYTYTLVSTLTTVPTPFGEDGRDGMAFSPTDSTRAVIIGEDPSSGLPTASLLTGLPGVPTIQSVNLSVKKTTLPRAAIQAIALDQQEDIRKGESIPARKILTTLTGVTEAVCVSITNDGTRAIIGTNAGLIMMSGVATGTLAQLSDPSNSANKTFNPNYTSGSSTAALGFVPTLALTLDGKYVVVAAESISVTGSTNGGNGSIILYPIESSWFGTQVSQLDGVYTPSNDQMSVH